MMQGGFALFDTVLGSCAVTWTETGINGVRLPQAESAALRATLRSRGLQEAAPPPAVADAIAGMTALLAGEAVDLSTVAVDLGACGAWERSVYAVVRGIPVGHTLTYGDVAARLGAPDRAREVGQALGRNPVPIIVPCHRVVAAQGRTGGFSAPGGVATKLKLLAIESAHAPLPLFAQGRV